MTSPLSRSARELFQSTRRPLGLMAGYATLIVALYRATDGAWITLPWSVPAMLGLTLAITTGFKATRGHEHATDAQRVWAAITAASRSWVLLGQAVLQDREVARQGLHRHLAWLAALRAQARLAAEPGAGASALQARERSAVLKRDLARHISARELSRVLAADNAASALLGLQAEALRAQLGADKLCPAPFLELHRLLHELQRLQAAAERLRQDPEATRPALADRLLLAVYGLLLPFGLLDAMGPLVLFDDYAVGALACAAIVPLSVVLTGLYLALDALAHPWRHPLDGHVDEAGAGDEARSLEHELRTTLSASPIVTLQPVRAGAPA